MVVDFIDKNSPATAAGIQPGDVVLELGGIKAVPKQLFAIRKVLEGTIGTEVSVTIRRGEERSEKGVVLGEW